MQATGSWFAGFRGEKPVGENLLARKSRGDRIGARERHGLEVGLDVRRALRGGETGRARRGGNRHLYYMCQYLPLRKYKIEMGCATEEEPPDRGTYFDTAIFVAKTPIESG